MKAFLIASGLLAMAFFTLAVIGLAMRSRPLGYVQYLNGTGREVWMSPPFRFGGNDQSKALKIPAHGSVSTGTLALADESYEVLAYGSDPASAQVVSRLAALPEPLARAQVSGEQILRSRTEGPLQFVLLEKGGKVAMHVGGYVPYERDFASVNEIGHAKRVASLQKAKDRWPKP